VLEQEAVQQTAEITDEGALKQTAEMTTDSVGAVQQTSDDSQTVEVTDMEAVKHTEDTASKPAVTQTEQCREKEQTMHYSEETLQAIEGLSC